MAILSSILAWRIPWTVQSMGSQSIGHDWESFTLLIELYSTLGNHHTHTLVDFFVLDNETLLWFWVKVILREVAFPAHPYFCIAIPLHFTSFLTSSSPVSPVSVYLSYISFARRSGYIFIYHLLPYMRVAFQLYTSCTLPFSFYIMPWKSLKSIHRDLPHSLSQLHTLPLSQCARVYSTTLL